MTQDKSKLIQQYTSSVSKLFSSQDLPKVEQVVTTLIDILPESILSSPDQLYGAIDNVLTQKTQEENLPLKEQQSLPDNTLFSIQIEPPGAFDIMDSDMKLI